MGNVASFNYIDLFAGIGGLRIGADLLGGRCVFTSEYDKFARETYRANHSDGVDHEFYEGDIKEKSADEIPDHDLLLAGFPCQPFSLAGVSKKISLGREHGFKDLTQGTLFHVIAEIINEKQPRAFLLENVKNLVSHDKGRTLEIILGRLRESGYEVRYQVIDSRSVLPQHRERCYIVGFRKQDNVKYLFDVHFDINHYSLELQPTLGDILHSPFDSVRSDGPTGRLGRYTDEYGKVDGKYVLSDKLYDYLKRYAMDHKSKGHGFSYSEIGPLDVTRTLSARYHKDGSEILVKIPRSNPRRLTPRECSRLMGFDKPGQADFRIPVSDTQAYRQFGNSVAVPVVNAILGELVFAMLNGHPKLGDWPIQLVMENS